MEGDRTRRLSCRSDQDISIHSLRMEGDFGRVTLSRFLQPFQSTPSAWRETFHNVTKSAVVRNFNPLPPHGGRHIDKRLESLHTYISIHSLRMEGDQQNGIYQGGRMLFQSTPSAWRETTDFFTEFFPKRHFNPLPPHGGRLRCFQNILLMFTISIHSLRMEGDHATRTVIFSTSNFNPLPPHGGRQVKKMPTLYDLTFQSTPSAWRETQSHVVYTDGKYISIHSLRMEGDISKDKNSQAYDPFQSTPSAWRETSVPIHFYNLRYISIHSLRMEGDTFAPLVQIALSISIHSLRMEGDSKTS